MRSKRKIYITLSNTFSTLFLYLFKGTVEGNNNILFVNTEKMGDLILCSDFLISFKHYTNFSKYYLCIQEQFIELLDWQNVGIIPVVLNKSKYKWNIFYRIKFILKVRKLRINKTINLTPERGMIDDEISLTSGAKEKTCFKIYSLFMTERFLKRNNKKYTEVFNSVENNEYKRYMSYIRQPVNGDSLIRTSSFNLEDSDYVVIAPMASEMDRTWGLEKYKELLKRVPEKIYLVGSKNERKDLDLMIPKEGNVINLAGELALPEISYLINNSKLFIGNDSGLSHIALNMNKKMVAIIGGGKHGIFFPYKERKDAVFLTNKMDCFGCSWFCIHDKMRCLTDLDVGTVLNSIDKLLYSKNSQLSKES